LTTSNKNFRVKNGLEVLGVSATVDGNEVLTTASTLDALANVDTTGVLDGNTIVFNEATSTFIAGAISGGAAFEISDTAPTTPSHGDVWYNSANSGLFIFIEDVDSSQWVQIGLTGPRGPQGLQGPEGPMGYTGATGAQGDPGLNGLDGLSAYEVAVNNGFSGTEQEWLDSLDGTDGVDGLGYNLQDATLDINLGEVVNSPTTLEVLANTDEYAYSVGDIVKLVMQYDSAGKVYSADSTTATPLNSNEPSYDEVEFTVDPNILSLYAGQGATAVDQNDSGWEISLYITSVSGTTFSAYWSTTAEPGASTAGTESSDWIITRDLINYPAPEDGPNISTYVVGEITEISSGIGYTLNVIEPSFGASVWESTSASMSIAGLKGSPGLQGLEGPEGSEGDPGADGAGYDYVLPEGFGGPGVAGEPVGNSTIGLNEGDFGAYAVGNYVRYYPNPEADPTAWVEGEITSRTGNESLIITVDNWSSTAPGISGANGSDEVRPYMTIVAKNGVDGVDGVDGAGYNYEPIPGTGYSYNLSTITPGSFLTLGAGKIGAYKVGDFVKWTSNSDDETYLYGKIFSLVTDPNEAVAVEVTQVNVGDTTTITSGRLSIAGLPGKSAYEIAVDEGFTGVEEDWLTALVPAGTVSQTARATAPPGYLLCDGSAVSRTTYARLFDAIGTAYGAGNNSTTFNIPNLQGRVPVGRDSSQSEFDVLGEVGGAKTHTLTTAQMPSHTHTQNAHNHTQDSHNHTQNAHGHNIHLGATQLGYTNSTAATGTNLGAMLGGNNGFVATNVTATNNATTATNQATTATNQNTGGGEAHNNLQPYVVLNYMIKI
jgi:microcystin-dependent protein